MTIQTVDAADVHKHFGRRCKTTPLREALAAMSEGGAIYVAYYDEQTGEGYNPSTIAQVAGKASRARTDQRFSVRRHPEGRGCYILCLKRDA